MVNIPFAHVYICWPRTQAIHASNIHVKMHGRPGYKVGIINCMTSLLDFAEFINIPITDHPTINIAIIITFCVGM